MKTIHGGDVYRNTVTLDYSVNINPLGIPAAVETALHEAVNHCMKYPDINAEKLRRKMAHKLNTEEQYLVFGNGASELFMAIVHALHPEKIVIPVPSFYGYEYAAGAVCEQIVYYQTKEENNFRLDEEFFEALSEDVSLLFLANPNNPTGQLCDREYLIKLLEHCAKKQIYVVLDECFIEFCTSAHSMLSEVETYKNLILVRAFTKIFAIPGVRLGYLISANSIFVQKIQRQLPEWNLSAFAQEAGCACAEEETFLEQTAAYVEKERNFLSEELRKTGIKVYDGTGDFILLYTTIPLYDLLLAEGILIRNCENFRGLGKGFYRIAVKSREENQILIEHIRKL